MGHWPKVCHVADLGEHAQEPIAQGMTYAPRTVGPWVKGFHLDATSLNGRMAGQAQVKQTNRCWRYDLDDVHAINKFFDRCEHLSAVRFSAQMMRCMQHTGTGADS